MKKMCIFYVEIRNFKFKLLNIVYFIKYKFLGLVICIRDVYIIYVLFLFVCNVFWLLYFLCEILWYELMCWIR